MIHRRIVAIVTAAGVASLLAAGCDSGNRDTAPPPTTTTVTTPAATTTTTSTSVPPPPTYPLTGLTAHSAAQLHDPAVVVKIDNVDAARPQTGLGSADVVYEEEVEGGLTRLAAIFQSDYPSVAGPVRSGRLTDEGIADDLNHPVYAYSGTNSTFEPILRAQPLTAVDDDDDPGAFYRVGDDVPHNLFTDVAELAKLSTTHTAPAPLFSFLKAGQAFGRTGAARAARIGIAFPSAAITWEYSATERAWLRYQNGTADVDTAGAQLDATNIVVMFVTYVSSGLATGEGVPPTPIPDAIQTGSGAAWVLSAGRLVEGTWTRASLTVPATLRDAAGARIELTPGRTWIELVPIGTSVSVFP